MKKTILEIYALAVCFFCVGCFVIVSGIAFYDVVQIASPATTLSRFQYERLTSNDGYRRSPGAGVGRTGADRETMPESDVTIRRQAEYAGALDAERHDGVQGLLRMAIAMFVDAVAFGIHWTIARRARHGAAG